MEGQVPGNKVITTGHALCLPLAPSMPLLQHLCRTSRQWSWLLGSSPATSCCWRCDLHCRCWCGCSGDRCGLCGSCRHSNGLPLLHLGHVLLLGGPHRDQRPASCTARSCDCRDAIDTPAQQWFWDRGRSAGTHLGARPALRTPQQKRRTGYSPGLSSARSSPSRRSRRCTLEMWCSTAMHSTPSQQPRR